MGVRLYEICGFVEVGEVKLDLKNWGWEGGEEDRWHRHLIMVRWPGDVEGLEGRWKVWRKERGMDEYTWA